MTLDEFDTKHPVIEDGPVLAEAESTYDEDHEVRVIGSRATLVYADNLHVRNIRADYDACNYTIVEVSGEYQNAGKFLLAGTPSYADLIDAYRLRHEGE